MIKCLLSQEELYDLFFYQLTFFQGWDGNSSTWVWSNDDHTEYYYGRVLPGRYEEKVMFKLTGDYAKMLWAQECYMNTKERDWEQWKELHYPKSKPSTKKKFEDSIKRLKCK